MPDVNNLIRHGKLESQTWQVFAPANDGNNGNADTNALPPDEHGWIVPLSTWQASHAALTRRKHPVAVLLPSNTDLPSWAGDDGKIDFSGLAFIAIDFPVYTDGRGYTLAQHLRHQYGYTGELRAVGDVLIDTIHYQARVGFDSFVVKPGHDPVKALAALNTFSVHYQKAYRRPAPPHTQS